MKKQFRLFPILLTIVLSIFSFVNIKLFPTVTATYVEGPITQDTVWTLVDSPFILSKDIIVYPGVTLTIEPGVEVRFGGAFSLIISGKVYANGTGRTITFTSHKEQPEIGDWDAIKFNGTETSTLIGCFIAYAEDGIYVENGDVEIKNSNITHCQNGITAVNGKLRIQNATIMENEENGVVITGNGQTSIQFTTIIANENGILLTGDEISNVDISQNLISANTQSGIQIDADDLSGITVVNNIVSSNDKGFYISSPTYTYITNNSISYNTIGILYDEGSHRASYNDIYGNEMGMDALSNAIVNAEYNYWGDSSGPYHEALNPNGRGNPVGGDGTNLDFIFFLTKSNGYINERPTANLEADKIWVPPNETVMFFATNSFDEGRIDRYFLEFGDGNNSGWTTLSVFTHKYSLGTYYANLRVMDDFGATSDMVTIIIRVQNLPQLHVDIKLSDSRVHEEEQVPVTVYVTNGTVAMENVAVTMFSVKGGNFTPSSGLTNASGYFVTTFTAPDVIEIANVRLIARASKNGIGYADGADYAYLEVSPFLSVQISAPNEIKSEEAALVIVNVRSNEQPVANASVIASCDGGNLYPETGITDLDGVFQLTFTAPQTTETLNVRINAIATKSGYMDGVGETIMTIKPKVLVVQITADSTVTLSEAELNVTVHVEYGMIPIVGANVTIVAETGNLSATAGLTDSYGNVTTIFTAPPVNQSSTITIVAQATMTGYARGESQLQITVNPRTFNIEIIAATVTSGKSETILVHVTCSEDSTSVAGATVKISSSDGSFSDITGVTDSSGYCPFIFNAPKTTAQLPVIIIANATRNGYVDGGNQTTITVTAETAAEGWPITTMLLIIIPLVIAVVVVILIKLKIIVVSSPEGEEQS